MTSEFEDRIALQDVMSRYAVAVDEKDYEAYRELFTEDVHVIGLTDEDMHGIEVFFPWWKEAIDKYDSTQHLFSPMLATFCLERVCRVFNVPHARAANGPRYIL